MQARASRRRGRRRDRTECRDRPKDKTPAQRSYDQLMKLYPFSVSEPEQIAALALFLASDESRMITGTTIGADGGKSTYLKVM